MQGSEESGARRPFPNLARARELKMHDSILECVRDSEDWVPFLITTLLDCLIACAPPCDDSGEVAECIAEFVR